ncbi:ferritin-like domain-containing protein [Suillus fuscotomentosus]|uniref:Ferritin-like domain-containing protein n=1 Tax=Suillus fuscotomentosus TaxID=1912939 RepID=A0AAD4HPL8_9AGAM|nr:ferritin-like domain-containing protein [Suillus fuscotomentosus]KAG1902894.1 ferritin-like domain-containing protein [Suillus fuscotomentosus]
MVFTSLYSLCGAGFALLQLLAPVTARPVARSTSSSTLLALQFANVLEQLESTFYAQALQKFNQSDFTAAGFASAQIPLQQFQAIFKDEATHTTTLQSAINSLGGKTVSNCTFNVASLLTDVPTMVAAARLVENVGVSAYLGALTLINDTVLSTAAATIMTVEARHQTILNVLAGATAIPQAFDVALNPSEILALTGGLISGCNLGIPANVPLRVNNSGSIQAGTKLTFTSAALNGTIPVGELSCQFLAGGFPVAISQPLSNCSVPANVTGPLLVFVTNSSQPLANNIRDAATSTIVAGPTLIFIDNQQDALAIAARPGLNSTVAPSGTSNPITSSTTITLTQVTSSRAMSSTVTSTKTSTLTLATSSKAMSGTVTLTMASTSTPATQSRAVTSTVTIVPTTISNGWTAVTTTISPSEASGILASAVPSMSSG